MGTTAHPTHPGDDTDDKSPEGSDLHLTEEERIWIRLAPSAEWSRSTLWKLLECWEDLDSDRRKATVRAVAESLDVRAPKPPQKAKSSERGSQGPYWQLGPSRADGWGEEADLE